MTDIEIKKGLAGVTVDYTAVSKVNPETNSLLYRGYPVQELAATQPFEAVAYLLWYGELPTEDELTALVAEERANRSLDDNVRQAIDLVPLDAHPMDVLRTAVSLIGASDPAAYDNSRESDLVKSRHLFAKLPAMVAYDQRRRHGLGLGGVHDVEEHGRRARHVQRHRRGIVRQHRLGIEHRPDLLVERQVPQPTGAVDELAQQHRATVAEHPGEDAELVAGVGLGDRGRSGRDRRAGEDGDLFGLPEPRRVEPELGEDPVPGDHDRGHRVVQRRHDQVADVAEEVQHG